MCWEISIKHCFSALSSSENKNDSENRFEMTKTITSGDVKSTGRNISGKFNLNTTVHRPACFSYGRVALKRIRKVRRIQRPAPKAGDKRQQSLASPATLTGRRLPTCRRG